MSRRARDGDYAPEDESEIIKKKSRKKKNSPEVKINKGVSETFLNKNQKEVYQLQSNGSKPKEIAKIICINHGLNENAVTPKMVSNFLGYQKRAGNHGTRSISLQNNNLRPDRSDNCMFSICFYFLNYIGYSDATRIANDDGVPLPDDQFSDSADLSFELQETRLSLAQSILRYVTLG